jgi:spore coat polysaccharide biosynthesis predicted glycosyltransferase SpsG
LAESADWLLVDGYRFGTDWLHRVRGSPRIALWTDHAHASELPVDLILNQNPHADLALYCFSAPGAKLLLGPDFMVLRKEFLGPVSRRCTRTFVRRILVTFGGGVADGAHDAFLDAAELLGERLPPTILLIGQDHPAREAIFLRSAKTSRVTARLATDDFPALVEASDLAVSAAGASLWELAALGVPSLALVIANNQEPLARYLEARGAGRSLGWVSASTPGILVDHLRHILENPGELAGMSRAALSLVDGRGATRVCDALVAFR